MQAGFLENEIYLRHTINFSSREQGSADFKIESTSPVTSNFDETFQRRSAGKYLQVYKEFFFR